MDSDTLKNLQDYYNANKDTKLQLTELLKDSARTNQFKAETPNLLLDYSKQHIDGEVLKQLKEISSQIGLQDKIKKMVAGEVLNTTEQRAVLHTALRAPRTEPALEIDGENVIEEVHIQLDKIKDLAGKVRSGEVLGCTGRRFNTILSIGIGGSYLGVKAAYEALQLTQTGYHTSRDYRMLFLADPDPLDFKLKALDIDVESTLVIVLSKSFTTAETLLNANTVKKYFVDNLKSISSFELNDETIISRHFCAVSTNLAKTHEFGIVDSRVFKIWDWVGGRFSVSSAIGVLSLSIVFGFDVVQELLDGMRDIDLSFQNEDFENNPSVVLGVIGWFNKTIEGYSTRAVLPYNQGLRSFFLHCQQVSMESNGKQVDLEGNVLETPAGVVVFGDSGTKGQHSFYQTLHQGKI